MTAANKISAQETANEFTNVKDVRGIFLYTKDNYIMAFLRVYALNINLLSQDEKRAKCQALTASFESDRKDFAYSAFPREIDLDVYKEDLKNLYNSELTDIGRRHLLAEMLIEANELATSGKNYEHQHYIKLWEPVSGDKSNAETVLKNRAEEFKERYANAGIRTEILKDADILKLCNLYGNPTQASYERVPDITIYEMIAKL